MNRKWVVASEEKQEGKNWKCECRPIFFKKFNKWEVERVHYLEENLQLRDVVLFCFCF